MIRLTTRDASILARLVQYDNLSQEQRLRILEEAGAEAKDIGRVLLGIEQPNSDDIRETVEAIRNWVEYNRQPSNAPRKQRSSRASYRYA